jgi:hypothetical protein
LPDKLITLRRFISLLLFPLFFLASCLGGPYGGGYTISVYVPSIGLGTIIAVVISWSRNKSVLWAIIHGLLGWLYVIYAVIVPKK